MASPWSTQFGSQFGGIAPSPPSPPTPLPNPPSAVNAKRTWGRVANEAGQLTWQIVTTDANGYNDEVYITTLVQCLRLVRGESPFWANYGIPSIQSVQTGIAPDFYTAQTQQQFASFFSSLIIYRLPNTFVKGAAPTPTYQVNIITNQGAILPPITVPTGIPT